MARPYCLDSADEHSLKEEGHTGVISAPPGVITAILGVSKELLGAFFEYIWPPLLP